jgi:ABC-2 type transport system permease protein
MKTFWSTLKNNYLRTIPRMVSLMLFTLFTIASIILAVYMTKLQQVKGHIVLVTKNSVETLPKSTAGLDIMVSAKKPPHSALVEQKYDAYVTIDRNGAYQVETLRNHHFKQMLCLLLQNPNRNVHDSKTDRGVGVNIMGFMMMFLLMMAFTSLFAFADDKEQGQLRRIAAAPISFGGYLAAHCVYCLSMVLPEYILLVVLKCCGFHIGFSLVQYAGLMIALGFLGISFALLLHTLIKKPDNANMLGNSVTVLTSVLAGSFYEFNKKNFILDKIITLIPQKQFMNFAQHLENGNAGQYRFSILYVIAFSTVLFVFSCSLLRLKYIKKV